MTQVNKSILLDDDGCMSIFTGVYYYDIDLKRIKTKTQLLWWVSHISSKGWTNTRAVKDMISAVCQIRRWNINIQPYHGERV